MSKFGITSMTISIDVSHKDYGNGQSFFANMTAKTPDAEPLPLDKISEVVDQGLKMYLTTFQTILTGQFATGNMTGKEFKELWAATEMKFEKIHKFLTTVEEEETVEA